MAEHDDVIRIRAHMREILRAFRERDAAALDRVFADDFAFTDPGGPVRGKQEWLADLASGDLTFDSIEAGEPEFRDLGDTVLAVGTATLRGRYSKGDYNGTFRYVGVYTKQGGDWKLTLTSADRVAPE